MADNQDIKTVLEDILRALQGATSGARGLAPALRDVAAATREAAGATEDYDNGLDSIAGPQESAIEREQRAAKARREAWKELQNETNEITSLSGALGVANRALDLYKKQNQSFAKAARNATITLKGMAAGAKVTAAALKGIFSIGGSLIGMFADIGAAIISIPFKFFNHIFSKAKQLMSGGTELAQAYEDVRKVFGNTGSGLGKSVIDLGKNLTKGLITPGLSARRVFGDMAEAIKYAEEVAAAAPETFQAVADQFSGKNGLEILAMAKGLGIANEDLTGIMDASIASGRDMESMLADVTKYAKGLGDAFGLNSKMISRSMAKAMKDVKHFANSTEKEIGQAVVYAQKLGTSLESITGILDAFNTFEQAADNVSKLSQAFGVNIDAMKMLEAKTPDEALDQIKQAFAAAGKSAENMNRQELQLIASSVGMDEATVKKTLSMKNAGVSMSNVKGVANSLEKQTLDTSQALSKLSKDIEKMVKAGQPPEGNNFFDIFLEGTLEGIDRTKEMKKLYMDTARAIQLVREQGRLFGAFLLDNFPGFEKFILGLTKRIHDVPALFADIRKSFETFIKGVKNGKTTFQGLIDMIRDNFKKFFGGDNSEMLSGLKEMWDIAKKILAEGINWVTDQLKEAFKVVLSFLKGDPTGDAMGMFGEASKEVKPITDALKRMWEELKDPIKDILEEAFLAALDALWKAFKALPIEAHLLMFGPSLVGGLGNILATKGGGMLLEKVLGKGTPPLPTTGRPLPIVRPPPLRPGSIPIPPAQVGAGGRFLAGAGGTASMAGMGAAAATVGAGAAAAGGLYAAYYNYDKLQQEMEYGSNLNAGFEMSLPSWLGGAGTTFFEGKSNRGPGMILAEAELEDVQAMQNSAMVSLDQKIALTQEYMAKQAEIMKNASSNSELYKDAEARLNSNAEALREFRKKREKEQLAFVEGTDEFNARLKKEAEERDKKENAAMLGKMGLKDNITLENAEKTLKNINEIAQKILNVNITEVLNKVREKFKNQNWTIIDADSQKNLKESLISLGHVVTLFEGFGRITQAAKTAVSQIADMGRADDPATPLGMLAKNAEGYVDTAIAVGGYVMTLGDWTTVKAQLQTAAGVAGDVGALMKGMSVASKGYGEVTPISEGDNEKKKQTVRYFVEIAQIVGNVLGSYETYIERTAKAVPMIQNLSPVFQAITDGMPKLVAAQSATAKLQDARTETKGIRNFIEASEVMVSLAADELEDIDDAKSNLNQFEPFVQSLASSIKAFNENEHKFTLYQNTDLGPYEDSADNFEKIMDKWIGAVNGIDDPGGAKTKADAVGTTAEAISAMVKKVTPIEGELNALGAQNWAAAVQNFGNATQIFSNNETNPNSLVSKLVFFNAPSSLVSRAANVTEMSKSISTLVGSFKTLKEDLTQIPLIEAKDAVTALNKAIAAVNDINKGLTKLELGERNVRVNLGKAVNNVTTRAFDPIKTASANISLTVNVSMSAADIERGLVNSPSTTIKAAFNELAAGQKMQVAGPGLKLGPIATTPGGEKP